MPGKFWTRIHPITGWHLLFPTSFTHLSIGVPYGLLSIVKWRQLGLPCSADSTRWISVCLFAGGILDRVKWHANTSTLPLTFLVQASQHLWPAHPHDIYQQFTYVTHTIISSSHPDDASRVEPLSRGTLPAEGWGLHCPPGFTQSRYRQCMPG